MNHGNISACLLVAIALYVLAGQSTTFMMALPYWAPQNSKAEPENAPFDPTRYLTNSFAGSVTLKRKGHLLEWCPDNTCHGFVSTANVPVAQLKDFAYLYIYFFSDYIYLPEWRRHAEAKDAAERVLSKPAYGNCKAESDLQAARCVLLDLSRGGRLRLIFVRYDENRRNVVPEDIAKELSRKSAPAR